MDSWVVRFIMINVMICFSNRKFYIFWEVTVLLVLHMDVCTPILYTIQESVNPVFNFGLFFVVNYKKYKCICHISFHFSLLYLQKLTKLLQRLNILVVIKKSCKCTIVKFNLAINGENLFWNHKSSHYKISIV